MSADWLVFLNRFWHLGLWGFLCFLGFSALAIYANLPGETGVVHREWTPVRGPQNEGYHLQVFLHPKCPCSLASLDELWEVTNAANERITDLEFFVTVPESDTAADWGQEAALLRKLGRWPEAKIHLDPSGQVAAQSGALTSGHVLVYSPQGQLEFSGGVTGSRGHRGDNPGRRALVKALNHQSHLANTPVFGCGL